MKISFPAWYNLLMAAHSAATASATPPKSPSSMKREFLLFMSIPAGIILLVILFLFVPRLLARPVYDFIYTYCPDYDCYNMVVDSSGIIANPNPSNPFNNSLRNGYENTYRRNAPDIYYYDIKQDAARRISLSEAGGYRLNSTSVAPDGYRLQQSTDSGGGFLLWGYSGDYQWYLQKGSLTKKSLHLEPQNSYHDIKLVGWVEK